MRKIYFLFVFSMLSTSVLYGQKNKRSLEIGAKLINEYFSTDGWGIGLGGQLVYKITKHSGIESGLYYQSKPVGFSIYISNGISNYIYSGKIAERRLLFPVFYRYSSKFINFSAGPELGYFLGWRAKSSSPGLTINNYDTNNLQFTFSAGVSKSFNLSESLILEPEVKYNLHLTEEDFGPAFNISLRKKLF